MTALTRRPRGAGWGGGLTHSEALENACEHLAEAPGHRPWVRADDFGLPEHTYGWECLTCDQDPGAYRSWLATVRAQDEDYRQEG